jgi:DNA-nicking Smr family endonuclease
MKLPPVEDGDLKLWTIVTSTVRPLRAQLRGHAQERSKPATQPTAPVIAKPSPPKPPAPPQFRRGAPAGPPPARKVAPMAHRPPDAIEPGRRRRIDRGRDIPAGVIDLHGLSQDEARAALTRFLLSAFADQRRNVLVITGKGALGDGVLRRRVPEWLAEAPLRQAVAGISEAHRRLGGEGALYVALRRPPAR